jgi:hypothetical protein
MLVMIYATLLLVCSFTLCVFGFFVGRCARKIPILDDHLPLAMHRGEITRHDCASNGGAADKSTCQADDT